MRAFILQQQIHSVSLSIVPPGGGGGGPELGAPKINFLAAGADVARPPDEMSVYFATTGPSAASKKNLRRPALPCPFLFCSFQNPRASGGDVRLTLSCQAQVARPGTQSTAHHAQGRRTARHHGRGSPGGGGGGHPRGRDRRDGTLSTPAGRRPRMQPGKQPLLPGQRRGASPPRRHRPGARSYWRKFLSTRRSRAGATPSEAPPAMPLLLQQISSQ